ncbi:pentatricopeptide repeat-containing protein At5g66520-like [Syzygium oleosum]|uniref:pentatricopeptide repeat-containing protein At5g66520-like n=1 Tax=Syzygium oleosum TaxID=219896 RepID=UPI0011D2C288|nr:pentatricopeptide repeat-containing protein At5g66520-like [Syzygium oleosum]
MPFSILVVPCKHPLRRFTRSFNAWARSIRKAAVSHPHRPHKAFDLYSRMHRCGIPFDSFSVLYTVRSCANLRDPTVIRHLHCHAVKLGFGSHVYVASSLLHAYVVASFRDARVLFDEMPQRTTVSWNTMITGFAKSGDVEKARSVFAEMPRRDVSSWSAMIAAYVNYGSVVSGLVLFREMMVKERLFPDQVTVCSALTGCARIGSCGLLAGKSIHGFVVKNSWEMNVAIGTVLVDMYTKCGFFKQAVRIFDMMKEKNVMTWTALICGSAQHGFSEEALSLFEIMQKRGVKPNELTFTGVLSACTNTGLVEEGRRYFNLIEEYGLELRIQHYGCMVDLLGKAVLLDEAYETIQTMKYEPNVIVWTAYLSACKTHNQFGMAERVIDRVLRMVKPENDGGIYTLICDIYVLSGKWDEAQRIRELMTKESVRKVTGSSSVKS